MRQRAMKPGRMLSVGVVLCVVLVLLGVNYRLHARVVSVETVTVRSTAVEQGLDVVADVKSVLPLRSSMDHNLVTVLARLPKDLAVIVSAGQHVYFHSRTLARVRWPAIIDTVSQAKGSGQYLLSVKLTKQFHAKVGQSLWLSGDLGRSKPYQWLPYRAILSDNHGSYVQLLDKGRVHRQVVTLGARMGDKVIVHGLSAGQTVAVGMHSPLIEGQSVLQKKA